MIRLRVRRPVHLGVAVGPRELVAVRLGPRKRPDTSEPWSRAITPPESDGAWPDLLRGFGELRESLQLGRARVHLALLPPLVQVKQIELPRLPDNTLRQVLTRDAARYFPGVRGPQVIGVCRLASGRRSPLPYLVTAAPGGVVECLIAAAMEVGWTVETIVSAQTAWTAAALQCWPSLARKPGHVLVAGTGRLEVLRIERGRLALARRFAERDSAGALGALGGTEPRHPCAIVAGDRRLELGRELEAAGCPVLPDDKQHRVRQPEVLAAQSARLSSGPQLLPERIQGEKRLREARLSTRLLAGAAALLLCTAGMEYWGTHRELAGLRLSRASIRANVAQAMTVREEMRALDARLRALTGAEARRSQWARTLVSVAEYLPAEAHLVGFRGDADSLRLEGEARNAAVVFESFQRAPGVVAVRADAPISQETRDSVPIERFALAARLSREPRGATP